MRLWLWLLPAVFVAAGTAYLLPAYVYNHFYLKPQAHWNILVSDSASTTPTESANLAYYISAEKLDPIFAIEGTNPTKLRAALTSLFAERDQFVSLYTPLQGQTIADSLYPTQFLELLPDLEEARQKMLQFPTISNAKNYHALLMAATSAYATDAHALSASLTKASSVIPEIGYIDGKANTSSMADKLQQVANEGLQQKKKEQARFMCLEQGAANCASLGALTAARTQKIAQAPAVFPSPTASMHKADALSAQILPLTTQFKGLSKTIFAVPTTCYPGNIAYMHEFYGEQVPGQVMRKQDIVNDIYFYDIPRQFKLTPQVSLLNGYTVNGIQIEYQSIGNLYMCPDSGFDVSNVGSLVGTLEAFNAQPSAVTDRLLALPFTQKADLQPWVQSQVAEDSLTSGAIAERYLEGSADFDQVIMGAYSDNHFLVNWDKKQNPVEFEYLMIARNFASMVFLMGNPTFMPQKISLFSDRVPNPLSKLLIREYNDDVSKQLTDAQIMDQTRKAVQINIGQGLRNQ